MESWLIQVIIALAQGAMILGGVILILRWNGYRRVSSLEFRKQTEICARQFKKMAAEERSVKVILKGINKHLKEIDSIIDKKFTGIEDRYDKRMSRIENELKKRGAK
jgi:hypothetical protein